MGHQRRIKEQRRRERAAHDQSIQPSATPEPPDCFWVVAFLDILGYRSALSEMGRKPPLPPRGSEEHSRLKEAVDRAVSIRRDIVGIVDDFMSSAPPSGPLPDVIPPEERARALAWRQFRIGHARFSDSLLFYVPLAPSSRHLLPMRAVHAMLLACSGAMLFQLARGSKDYRATLPFRGAIDANVGTERADQPRRGSAEKPPLQLYSAAMATAYEMETTLAKWPRILVSENFRDVIRSHADAVGEDQLARMTRNWAKECGKFLFQDTDSLWAVDYLGAGMLGQSNVDLRPHVRRAHAFVRAARTAHATKTNADLVHKYDHLEHYIASRLSLWQ